MLSLSFTIGALGWIGQVPRNLNVTAALRERATLNTHTENDVTEYFCHLPNPIRSGSRIHV
jgi:hypothetical protein